MKYYSTRDIAQAYPLPSHQAIIKGLAPDGGLYMPEVLPRLPLEALSGMGALDYAGRAAFVLGMFLNDYPAGFLRKSCASAYGADNFGGEPAPVYALDTNTHILELWHGPTCAFKDMALQIMPYLLSGALELDGGSRQALILVATSGDTGKAALEGYRDIKNTSILVFYPQDGVSHVQKLQMQTQEGGNVGVCAISGNFDDAQNGVKRIFGDGNIAHELGAKGLSLSSANSINWGRLAPQIVYYISAYLDMVASGAIRLGEQIDVCVPTGNFGNILAAYIAREMGLPIAALVCASNKNDVLTQFLRTGIYDRNREFFTTISPSMDILISSNLERLIYLMAGPEKTASHMKNLSETGRYELSTDELSHISRVFAGYQADDEQTRATIARIFAENGYLIDTHTAVAVCAAEQYRSERGSSRKLLICSTASPFKFASDVCESLSIPAPGEGFEALDALSRFSGLAIPGNLDEVRHKAVRFTETVDPKDMAEVVLRFAEEMGNK